MTPTTGISSEAFVHPSAFVEDGATVGRRTKVWHHSHIRTGANVGDDCVLGKNVFVDTGVTVGDRTKLQNNVSVYDGVTIGNDVFVGPSVTFTNDIAPRAFNNDWKITPTSIEDGASIGANATVVCGNTVGKFAMVAAGATVARDVASNELVAGTPARTIGWVCECGAVASREVERPESTTCTACEEEK